MPRAAQFAFISPLLLLGLVTVLATSGMSAAAGFYPEPMESFEGANLAARFGHSQDEGQGEEAEEVEDAEEKEDAEETSQDKPAEEKKPQPAETKTDSKPAAEQKTEAKADEKAQPKGDEKTEAKQEEKPAAKPEEKPAATTAEKPAAKPPAKKRKTHTVATKRMKVEVPVDGTFVARKMDEVILRPESWSGYEIKEVVEHGATVRRGQVLVKFDDKRINEAIDDLRLEQTLNDLAIQRTEEELPRQERTLALTLENAERSNRETKEDYQRYNDIDRPMIVKQYEYTVKRSQFNLDYEKEELEQLEKMYAADDLTEETEEIILKRQRNLVDFAEFSLVSAQRNREEVMDILLPRLDIQVKQSLEAAEMALARAKMASAIELPKSRYELEQRKISRIKSNERMVKLLADKGLMELKAPTDGVVYYGQCVDGRWSDMASLITRLKPKSTVSSGTVVMTIIQPRPLYVSSTVDETKRPDVSAGQKIKVQPPVEGSARIDGKVAKITNVPTGAGRFALELELAENGIPDWVVAGMTCKVKIATYDKADAVVVPKPAVRTDEDDEEVKYVWVVTSDNPEDKAERRVVTVGKSSGTDVEIVKGLKKGEMVSLDDESGKPKEE